MEFDWLNLSYDLRSVPPREIEETFEDPFCLRLLPEIPSAGDDARYFNLGKTVAGRGIFSVFWTNGKICRVLLARDMTVEEKAFFERRNAEAGNAV